MGIPMTVEIENVDTSLADSATPETAKSETSDASAELTPDQNQSNLENEAGQSAEAKEAELQASKEADGSDVGSEDGKPPVEETAKKANRSEKRISQLTARRREAERARDVALAETKVLTERLAKRDNPAPNEADFDDYAKYQAALNVHEYRQFSKADREDEIKDSQERSTAAQADVQQASEDAFRVSVEDLAERVPDFEKKLVASKFVPSPLLGEEILNSEQGAEVLYHLIRNPSEADAITALKSPGAVAKAVGRIEGRLSAPPPPKRVSQAPAPVGSVAKGQGSAPVFNAHKASAAEIKAELQRGKVIR